MENVTVEIELDPVQLEQVLGAHAETERELAEVRVDLARLRAHWNRQFDEMKAQIAALQRPLPTSERGTPWG